LVDLSIIFIILSIFLVLQQYKTYTLTTIYCTPWQNQQSHDR